MTNNLVSTLWIAWAALAVITALLYAYRGRLTRDEEGQIFLDEAFDHEKAAQAEIVKKVNRVEPLVHVSLGLTALMTLVMIGYYAWMGSKALFG
jgi:hypothetical protein